MAAIRAKEGISQTSAAKMLGIGERSYKNYETESRDLPLAVAIRICERFEVELNWLVFGQESIANAQAVELVGKTIAAVVSEAERRGVKLSPSRAKKFAKHAYTNSIARNSDPADEISVIFDLLSESD